jgi:peptide/nickel transport system permease protein
MRVFGKTKDERTIIKDSLHIVFRNRLASLGFVIVIMVSISAIVAPWLTTHDPFQMNLADRLASPSRNHLLGTDTYGRDMFTRILLGSSIAMQVALAAVTVAFVIGVPLGGISGYMGGAVDTIVMRLVDALLAFPGRLLAIALVAATGTSFVTLCAAIGVNAIPGYIRIVRAAVIVQKEKEYAESARMSGESGTRILLAEIFPNCLAPIFVLVTLDFAHAILLESSLSFLGLGFAPPAPSWGLMLAEARGFIEIAPHVAIFPGLAISMTILGFNLLGDGLRDVFDPRQYES